MIDQNVQELVQQLMAEDEDAATQVVEQYYSRLQRVARAKLRSLPNPVADDEGAVVSALRSFFSGVKNDQSEN